MTSQERYNRCFHYLPIDHVVDMEFGFWTENHILWQKEGLPPGLDTHEKMELYFGFERRWRPPVNVLLQPEFQKEELDLKDGYRYFYDEDHVLCRILENGGTTMPEHLEYPLKSRKDWETVFKPRFDHNTPGRYPADVVKIIDDALSKDYTPWLYVGSLFGRLRNFIGFQEICYMLYDDPKLIDEMIGHLADVTCEILERVMPLIQGKVLIGHFWEDICFKTGPMISPEYFEEHVVPRYKEIVHILRKFGIDTILVDCDGYIEPLIECWLNSGINIMFPLERTSGTDPVSLRKKYGKEILLMGGVDKQKIAEGGDAIVRELESLAPLVEEGGFIPHCDHLCPSNVTLENYRLYLRKKREIFGIPEKEEKIRKYPFEW